MIKKIFSISTVALVLMLASCNGQEYNPFVDKITGNEDFMNLGNMVNSDFAIDGVLDNPEWENPTLDITFGGTSTCPAQVEAKVYFGDNGLSVGFLVHDTMISASTNYTDPQFVVNSDNVEFYIDTKNDKGQIAKSDDYAFLINPEEFAEMRVGTGSYWGPWSGVIDYAVKINDNGTLNNDSDVDTTWGCEIFLPYTTFGFTKEDTVGIAFGCRDKTTNLSTSEWAGWTPDPQIIDTYVSISKNGIAVLEVNDYKMATGEMTYDAETEIYTTTSSRALAVSKTQEFVNGTYSVDMLLPGELRGDNGLIFQVKSSETGLFWEEKGCRYIFFCINKDGIALMGLVNGGSWTTLGDSACAYKLNDWNNLSVVVDGKKVSGYVNGNLCVSFERKLYETYGVGLRTGGSDVQFKNMKISSDVTVETPNTNLNGYKNVHGAFSYSDTDQTYVNSVMGNSMMIADSTLFNGTLTTTVHTNTPSDNGIVFRVTDNNSSSYWESGVSYYFFFVNRDGNAYLGKVYNGWTEVKSVGIAGYNISQTYELKVVLDGDSIKCYVNDVLYVDAVDSDCTGSGYGLRSGSLGTTFTELIVDKK